MLRTIQKQTDRGHREFLRMIEPHRWAAVRTPESHLDLMREEFVQGLRELLRELRSTPIAAQDWAGLQQVLASLPLTTDEFGQAHNRLLNANRYAKANEFGVARFELRLLLNSMARVA